MLETACRLLCHVGNAFAAKQRPQQRNQPRFALIHGVHLSSTTGSGMLKCLQSAAQNSVTSPDCQSKVLSEDKTQDTLTASTASCLYRLLLSHDSTSVGMLAKHMPQQHIIVCTNTFSVTDAACPYSHRSVQYTVPVTTAVPIPQLHCAVLCGRQSDLARSLISQMSGEQETCSKHSSQRKHHQHQPHPQHLNTICTAKARTMCHITPAVQTE